MIYQRFRLLVKWASLITPVFFVPALILNDRNRPTLAAFIEVCLYIATVLGISSAVLGVGLTIKDWRCTGKWDKLFLRASLVGLGSIALFMFLTGLLFGIAMANFDRAR